MIRTAARAYGFLAADVSREVEKPGTSALPVREAGRGTASARARSRREMASRDQASLRMV